MVRIAPLPGLMTDWLKVALSQLVEPDVTDQPAPTVIVLPLVFVMLTVALVTMLSKETVVVEAVRVVLPPPPLVSKVTVITTSAAPLVGCRVTLADAPEVIPDELPFRRPKVRNAGVVEVPLGVTTNQLPEPVVSTE
jgi:hypothetical protein